MGFEQFVGEKDCVEAIDKLMVSHKDRLHELIEARKAGKKVIGYPPGGYLPEELVIMLLSVKGGKRWNGMM